MSGWALLVVGGDGLDDSSGSLSSRVVVANTTAGRLSSASRVDNGLRTSARVGGLDLVHETSTGSESIALGNSGLTSAEDVDLRAGLPLGDLDRASNGETGEQSSCGGNLHVAQSLTFVGIGACVV